MLTAQEKAAFSERLKSALRKSDHPIKGTINLARLFNLQHLTASCIGISVQTAHKWLNGLAIPTADKVAMLAKWLNVSERWLHYGSPSTELPSEICSLVEKIGILPEHKRHLVKDLVTHLSE